MPPQTPIDEEEIVRNCVCWSFMKDLVRRGLVVFIGKPNGKSLRRLDWARGSDLELQKCRKQKDSVAARGGVDPKVCRFCYIHGEENDDDDDHEQHLKMHDFKFEEIVTGWSLKKDAEQRGLVVFLGRPDGRSLRRLVWAPEYDLELRKCRNPICRRCNNHGVAIEPVERVRFWNMMKISYLLWAGHKNYCEWKSCKCKQCLLIKRRQKVVRQVANQRDVANKKTIIDRPVAVKGKVDPKVCRFCYIHGQGNEDDDHESHLKMFLKCRCKDCRIEKKRIIRENDLQSDESSSDFSDRDDVPVNPSRALKRKAHLSKKRSDGEHGNSGELSLKLTSESK